MNPRALSLVVAVLLIPSCIFHPDEGELREVPLSKLADRELFIDIAQNPSGGPAGMQLVAMLHYAGVGSDHHCVTIPGLEAVLGPAVIAAFPGGWGYQTPFDQRISCLAPSVTIAVDELVRDQGLARNNATLVLRDASDRIVMPLDDLLVTRTAELVAPPAQGYRVGDLVRVRWQPASDLDQGRGRVALEGPQGRVALLYPDMVSHEGDQLTFWVPESARALGLGTLRPTVEVLLYDRGAAPKLAAFEDPRASRIASYTQALSFPVLP